MGDGLVQVVDDDGDLSQKKNSVPILCRELQSISEAMFRRWLKASQC